MCPDQRRETAADYSKHKDRDPIQTVEFIKGTLERIGLRTNLVWTSRQFDGTFSNRVSVEGTSLGTNGKGTSEEYATASGYAELMERLQNKMVGHRTHVCETFAKHGFYDYPDERMSRAQDVVARRDKVIDGWFGAWGLKEDSERLEYLSALSEAHHKRSDALLAEIPFADVFDNCIRWIPSGMCRELFGSNGMCAGNTLEECLVQGLSEIFERYVKAKVLRGEVTPPPIPRSELERWSVGDLIARIEDSGQYRVLVYDGSLGTGYPVVLTAIVDRFRGTFGVNCGAHPSMAVAVERTLTEAFQGRNIEQFTSICNIAPVERSSHPANMLSMIICGEGSYPASLFAGKPSWDYERWPEDAGLSNAELLEAMVGLLRRDGFTLLVRNASFLGFPTCHILVPGMSESRGVSPVSRLHAKDRKAQRKAISRFPTIGPEQQEQILAIEKHYAFAPNLANFGRPFTGGKMRAVRVFGFLHLAREEFAAARRSFLWQEQTVAMPGSLYWQAMARYAGWRDEGLSHEEAIELVRTLYLPAFARRVEADTEPGPDMLARLFPQMNCFDCAHCELAAAGGCAALADSEAFTKIDAAIAQSKVSQEEILRLFGR